jgi:hypothetical protein
MESLQKASRNSVKTPPDKSETHAIWGADQEGSDIEVWCVERWNVENVTGKELTLWEKSVGWEIIAAGVK